MRESKYRAWDKEDKRMIVDKQDFIPLIATNLGVMKLDPTSKENRWILLPRERFVLMQSTGLTDKNGVDVFRTDKVIIRDEGDEIGVIEWDETELRYVVEFDTYTLELGNFYSKEIEVVGNTHDEVSK